MLLPQGYERYDGLLILCIVIVVLLSILLVSFVIAYMFQWEVLMTQIRIQRDKAARKKQQKDGAMAHLPKHIEALKVNNS